MNKSSSTPDPNAETPGQNAGDDALDMLLHPAPATAANATVKVAASVGAENAAPAPQLDGPPALQKLDEATRGLLMQSESDEPFRTVYWPLDKAEITASEVALYLTENADATVETQSVEKFFANATRIENWMGDEEKATAKRFADLVEIINSELEKPQVYLIGERERTAAVIGKIKGGFAGIVTLVVET